MASGAPKLVVVSTRLPVAMSRGDSGWEAKSSPGGLATGLRAVAAERAFTWIGWPGADVPEPEQPEVRDRLAALDAVPVFLDAGELSGFYEEFSNRLLWPLFHHLPEKLTYDAASWAMYRRVNERFADAVCDIARPGDVVWIHDYQLTLVPQMLRARGVDCAIGFFLHIPFPASEAYRTLPVREAILRGMLGADLIGFHTYEYVSHFRSACLRILGLDSEPETVWLSTHAARLGVLPIGIDPDEMRALARCEATQTELAELRPRFAGKRVALGVDRLDYTKGIPHKLRAWETLLANHPELRGEVVLIQVASPSRTAVVEYQALKREVDELIGHINGRYGTLDVAPIVYIYQNLSRQRLAALYQLADVALITPLRDGMNLVALEYIAARDGVPGTLVLSEFAGAAACLSDARLINPYDAEQIAETLATALTTPPSPTGFQHMADFVDTNTSVAWAERFLRRLEQTYEELRVGVQRLDVIDDPATRELVDRARRPLLLLDYDGTLVRHVAVPSAATPTPRALALVDALTRFATVYVVSGRPAAVLDDWLGHLPIGMVCEHGLAIKPPGEPWPEREPVDRSVLEDVVRPVFRDFVERTPGSRIEDKEASIAWHYRGADPKLGSWRAKELHMLLEDRLRGVNYSVLAGSRVIEVRPADMTKGAATTRLLDRYTDADLVLCAGDDRTDEEMFEAVLRSGRDRVLVCRVASRNTIGQYFVDSVDALLDQLEAVANLWRTRRP